MSGTVLLAFGLWLLLTSDFSWGNIILGFVGALLVSWVPKHRFSAYQLVSLVIGALSCLPVALWQSFSMVFNHRLVECIERVRLKNPTDPWACFRQVFLVTCTPSSLVISDEQEGHVQLHSLKKKDAE
jgi:multisubunit Na+/H+ antiporter MnhE subunit